MRIIANPSSSVLLVKCVTPDLLACMLAPPKSSWETSSPVTVFTTLGPVKIAEYKTHNNPQGVSGWLCEGRVYYDAFVLKNKKDAILVSKEPN